MFGHYWHAISMAFRWRADDGQFLAAFRSSLHPIKKNKKNTKNFIIGPPLTKFSESAHGLDTFFDHLTQ